MGDGERGGWGKRLNWIRGVLIETGEKGGKLLELVHTEVSILFDTGTHTHKLSRPRRRCLLNEARDYSDIPW